MPTPTSDEVEEAIKTAAAGPYSVTVDGTTVTQQSLSNLMAYEQRMRSTEAANRTNRGLRLSRISQPGAGD